MPTASFSLRLHGPNADVSPHNSHPSPLRWRLNDVFEKSTSFFSFTSSRPPRIKVKNRKYTHFLKEKKEEGWQRGRSENEKAAGWVLTGGQAVTISSRSKSALINREHKPPSFWNHTPSAFWLFPTESSTYSLSKNTLGLVCVPDLKPRLQIFK